MKFLRTAQFLVFLITLGVGLAGLFVWEPQGKLRRVESYVSPLLTNKIGLTSLIEDAPNAEDGSRSLRELAPAAKIDHNYLLCEIDDDPDGLNAFGIYHPTDIAITLGNLKEQGVEHLFISSHLHWPQLEPEEKSTLATAMSSFKNVVVAAPVRRNLSSEPITPAFLRASIPASEVVGDSALLPAINSLSVAPDVLFPDNTYAGFSMLESEKATNAQPLVARWDERIIFSAPLLALMQRSNVTPEQLFVHAGKHIRIGNTGNLIPIDAFGRFEPKADLTPKPPARTLTSAESGAASIIGATQRFAILTATGEKSSHFEAVRDPFRKIAQLSYTPSTLGDTPLKRMPQWLEILIIADAAFLAALFLSFHGKKRHVLYAGSLVFTWIVLAGIYHLAHYWTPLSLPLFPFAVAWLISAASNKSQISNS